MSQVIFPNFGKSNYGSSNNDVSTEYRYLCWLQVLATRHYSATKDESRFFTNPADAVRDIKDGATIIVGGMLSLFALLLLLVL